MHFRIGQPHPPLDPQPHGAHRRPNAPIPPFPSHELIHEWFLPTPDSMHAAPPLNLLPWMSPATCRCRKPVLHQPNSVTLSRPTQPSLFSFDPQIQRVSLRTPPLPIPASLIVAPNWVQVQIPCPHLRKAQSRQSEFLGATDLNYLPPPNLIPPIAPPRHLYPFHAPALERRESFSLPQSHATPAHQCQCTGCDAPPHKLPLNYPEPPPPLLR